MCDTIVHSSIRLWAQAVEDYYTSMDKARLDTIVPHSTCWTGNNNNMDNIKYHYGKNFYKYLSF